MYHIVVTNRFEKEVKLAVKRGKKLEKLKSVMQMLASGEPLPPRNRDHTLVGNFAGRRECHIEPDWLLIYKLDNANQTIIFERTGTHADLF